MALTNEQLDSIGAAQVRANLDTSVYLGNDRAIAVGWLAQHEEASNIAQLDLARSSSTAAHKANSIALAAVEEAKRAADAAERQAVTAERATRIAVAALIVAVAAAILSVIGMVRH
jgi:hypothetical protein